jgi:hypothetical protein
MINEFSGLHIIDISDPSNPILVSDYNTPGRAWGVYVSNGYIYVADTYSFLILEFSQTGIGEIEELPGQFSLSQNFPNPFNASTNISFALSEPQNVVLNVYDLLGREVGTLIDERMPAGAHTTVFDASALSSGIYFYRLRAGDLDETKSMILLK